MLIDIKNYLYKVRWTIVAIIIVTLLAHGSILFSQRFGADTEYMMAGIHNFDVIGRQGLIWISNLLGFEWFNLYYVQVLTVLFMICTPIAFGYLFYRTSEQKTCLNILLLVLSFSFIVSPFWVAQIYFLNQSSQVLLSCILIAISILFAEEARGQLQNRWYFVLLAIVMMQVIFSCYQVLVLMYVVTVIAVFLIRSTPKEYTLKQQLQWIGYHSCVFAVGFLVYILISNLFFMSQSDYLLTQIAWTRVGIREGIRNCIYAVGGSLLNNPPYYTGFYGIFFLIMFSISIYKLLKAKKLKKWNSVLYLLVELFLFASPYVFILLYGNPIPDRMQLILPLSQGCVLYLTVLLLYEERTQRTGFSLLLLKGISVLLVFALCKDNLTNLSYCNRFYYTDEWRYQYDTNIAKDVYQDVKALQAAHEQNNFYDNIVILGYPDIPYNEICLRGEIIGQSAFQFQHYAGYLNRQRILYFMRNTGYPLEPLFTEGEEKAFDAYFEDYFSETVDAMPCYPLPGYAQYITNDEIGLEYLIIKLGNDWRLSN